MDGFFDLVRSIFAASDPDPTYYVSCVDGNDANDGKTRATAWQTMQQAARVTGPGDTIRAIGMFGEIRTIGIGGRRSTLP